MYSSVALCSRGEDFGPLRGERPCFLRELCRIKCPPLNVIIMREQLNVKQRQAISETPAKGGGGGLVETCFSLLGRMAAVPDKRPWLGCCLQGSVLIECNLKIRRISTDKRACRYQLQNCCHAEIETRSSTQAIPIGAVSINNLRFCGHLGWHFSDGHEP